ncbi:MAG: amino acid ABC transporter substrate-binding protein [Selenomonadaceae bacterium]|nr:amino acid ABC transporter substrate-binding protein [Selenomonadaceae bacterium]
MKKMVFMMILILFIAGCGSNYKIKDKIIVGLDESPIGYVNEQGEIVGFEVDLAREAIKRAGSTAEFKMISWNEKELELNSGKIDIIWNGLDITPERQEKILFSNPYMDNGIVMVVMEGNPQRIFSEVDLKGKNVGAKAGTTAEYYIESTASIKNIIKDLKTYDSDEKTFTALENGKIDVLLCDVIVGRYEMIKHNNNFEILPKTLGGITEYGIGFRKKDVELRDEIQKAFDSMIKDGTAKEISEKWFQADLIRHGK